MKTTLTVVLLAACIGAPSVAASAKSCRISRECPGDALCFQGACVPRAKVRGACSKEAACPEPYDYPFFYLDRFCTGELDGKILRHIDDALAEGKIGADHLVPVFNMHGAAYGYEFKQLRSLNTFYYHAARAVWLPASCVSLVKKYPAQRDVPKELAAARDEVMKRWRAAKVPEPQGAAAEPAIAEMVRDCSEELAEDEPFVKGLAGATIEKLGEGEGWRLGRATIDGAAYLALTWTRDDEARCDVFPWRGLRAVSGRFGLGKGQGHAVVAEPLGGCHKEDCALPVFFLDAKGKVESIGDMGLDCDYGFELRALSLFPGQDSLVAACRKSTGAAYHEYHVVGHARDGRLAEVLRFEGGMREYLTPDEEAEGMCPVRPIGWLKKKAAGPEPVLEVYRPKEVGQSGEAILADYVWSPAEGRFVQRGAGVTKPYQARRCE